MIILDINGLDPLILLLFHFCLIGGLILSVGHTRLKYINFQHTFFRLRDVFSRIDPTTLRNLFSRISLVNGLLTFLLNSLSRLCCSPNSSLIAASLQFEYVFPRFCET